MFNKRFIKYRSWRLPGCTTTGSSAQSVRHGELCSTFLLPASLVELDQWPRTVCSYSTRLVFLNSVTMIQLSVMVEGDLWLRSDNNFTHAGVSDAFSFIFRSNYWLHFLNRCLSTLCTYVQMLNELVINNFTTRFYSYVPNILRTRKISLLPCCA